MDLNHIEGVESTGLEDCTYFHLLKELMLCIVSFNYVKKNKHFYRSSCEVLRIFSLLWDICFFM